MIVFILYLLTIVCANLAIVLVGDKRRAVLAGMLNRRCG